MKRRVGRGGGGEETGEGGDRGGRVDEGTGVGGSWGGEEVVGGLEEVPGHERWERMELGWIGFGEGRG